MANDKGHKLLTKAAIECLPDWQQAIWKKEKEKLEDIYCMYGDTYFGNKKEEAKRYMEMPDGRTPVIPWVYRVFKTIGPGKNFFICGYYKLARYVFDHYISQIVQNLREGKIEQSAKFAGVLAHFIEDTGCPSHSIGVDLAVDMEIVKLLLPPPNKEKRLMQFHNILEGEYEEFSLKNYKPKLLGLSATEASFNLLEEFTDMLENSIKQILPMVGAFYKDDYKTLKKHLMDAGKFSAKILADAFYTSFCIAYQKLDEKQEKELKKVKINKLTPYRWTGWAPYPYFFPVVRNSNMSMDKGFKSVPLRLNINGRVKEFREGFGVGVPFEITYILPKGVYKKFKSFIGLHSELGKGGEIIFKIKVDNKIVFNSKTIKDCKGQEIEVFLKYGEKLTLVTLPTEKSYGKIENQAVWAEPVLEK